VAVRSGADSVRERLVKRLDRILVAALWAVAAVAASAATERTVVPLAPGLDYVRLTADGPVVTHLLLADLNVPSLRPAVAMAGPQVLGVETLSEIVNAVETGTQRVAGAINGGHAVTRPGSFRGAPIGLLIAGRELLCDPWPVPRSAFLLLADGTPRIERLAMQGKLAGPDGQAVRLGGLNRRRLPGELVLYTARFNPATRIDEAGVQLVVAGAFKDGRMLVAGQSYTGRVEAKVDGRVNVEIPPDGVVLAGSGPSESWLEARKIGEPVTFSFELTPDVGQVTDALGAGPRILRDGQVAIEAAQEQLGVTLQTGPQPRSAVGYAGRKLVFAAVDGRDSAHSLGLELPALAQLLLDEGCTDAMELDGGGATTLYARDRVINQPSDGMPRPLASALVLLTSGALTTDALPGTLAADGAAPVPTPVRPTPPTTPTVPPVTPVTPTVPPVTPVTPTTPTVPDTPTTPSTPLVDGTPVRLRTVPADLRGEPGEALPMQIIAEDAEGRAVRFNAADLRFDVAPPALGEIDASGRFLARVPGVGRVKISLGDMSTIVGVKISQRAGEGGLPTIRPPDGPGVLTPDTPSTPPRRRHRRRPAHGDADRPRVAPAVPDGTWRQFDGFEQAKHWTSKVNPAELPGGFSIVKKNIRLEGEHCGELKYDFTTTNEPRMVYALYNHGVGSPKFVSVYIFGDGQGHALKGQFLDNKTGQRYTVTFAEHINWDHQWRRCGAVIPDEVKGVVIWESIYLVQTRPEVKSAGAVYLDKLEGVY